METASRNVASFTNDELINYTRMQRHDEWLAMLFAERLEVTEDDYAIEQIYAASLDKALQEMTTARDEARALLSRALDEVHMLRRRLLIAEHNATHNEERA